MMMCIQNLVSFCQFVLKILSKKRILTSSKGSNSVANLRKTKINNTNIDLANDNVYTKFGLNLFILSQDIEQLDLMFMKHYAPNRCLYIKVAKLRTGVGSAETSYLQNCSVKLFKEHFKVQICKERLFEKNKITFLLIFTN